MEEGQKIKLALIEDDIAIVQMYRTKFEFEGYQVATAGDGVAGLELIESFKPDVVLLDIMMPKMDGLKVLEKIRANPKTKDTKVIVLTNMGDTKTAEQIYKMAATDYIVKAEMTPREVSERVKKILAA